MIRWGARCGYTRYSTRFTRYDTSFWYTIIYKLRCKIYKLYRSYLQAEVQDLQAIQELFTSFIKMRDWLEHQGNKRVAMGMVNGWARDRVVIDNGSVWVHKVPELPGFYQGTYLRRLNCQVFTIGRLFLFTIFVFFCFFTSWVYQGSSSIELLEMNDVSRIIQEFSFWCR